LETCLVGQFWGLDSDRILKLVLGEIILSQKIQMPPGSRRAMGDGLQQFLPFGWIIDLGEFLRQVQVIPADDAILDEPFAGLAAWPTKRGEDTIRTLKHAKRLRRSHVHGCGAAEIHLDRGSAMCPSGNRRLD
jgi:hypothetical protein